MFLFIGLSNKEKCTQLNRIFMFPFQIASFNHQYILYSASYLNVQKGRIVSHLPVHPSTLCVCDWFNKQSQLKYFHVFYFSNSGLYETLRLLNDFYLLILTYFLFHSKMKLQIGITFLEKYITLTSNLTSRTQVKEITG